MAKKNFEISLSLMTVKTESQILPQLWTKDGNRGGLQVSPVHIDLKPPYRKGTENTIPHSPRGEVRSETHN